jgi:MYXO-CTERM domain-containing protein
LAGILTSARTYLAGVRSTDTQAGCRPYRVILVTDGAETCGGDPVAAAAALFAAGIPVHVIGFATADVTIQANLNAIASAGGTGSAIFADDATTLSTAIASIVTSTILVELCNGVDDDCDGLIDEDFPDKGAACDNGLLGACLRPGTRVCRADGLGTECNAPGATGTTEVCNGVDDDCDGLIDEGFPLLNTPCDNGLTGMCRTTGSYQCTADGSGTYCTAVPLVGGTEVCNGLDDDCDGLIDEDPLGPPIGGPCGGGGGACTPGTLRCVSGAIECVGGSTGTAEICNGQDDDCDGFIDEPVLPGVGDPCTDPGFETIGDTGECELGQTICAGGMIECGGYVGPRPELCNGRDDDCDGMADDMAPCPDPGDLCVNTVCASPCGTTEFRCPFGFFCQTLPEGDYCLPDRCQDNPCPAGTVCDMVTGECQDACATVTCMPGETCDDGACLDCFDAALACPAGQVCIAGASGVGACQPDPCFGIPCAAGQFCRDGACQAIDCDPACAPDQLCQDGTCVDNACGDMHLCTGTSCRPGEACHPGTGRCIADPCITTTCPAGYGCQVSCQGTSLCELLPAAPGVDIVAAGGGCACRVGPAPRHGTRAAAGVGLAVLALALLLAGRRRR